jgi:hypothetical protein
VCTDCVSLLGVCPDAPRPSFSIANKSATMDKASRVLAQPVLPSLSESYRARADRSGVPHTTLHHRACGRRSIEAKAQSQQYLAPYEEDALVHFLLQLSDLGQPVRIKYIRFLAFCVTRQRPETTVHRSRPVGTGLRVLRNATQRHKREESKRWTGIVTRRTPMGR